jgi:hypothetical protein
MSEPHTEPRGRPTGALVLGALLAAIGLVWLLATLDAVPISLQVGLGLLLLVVGAAIALLPEGGHHVLLVTSGIVLAALAWGVLALNLDLVADGVGERRHAPTALADVEHDYTLGVGSLGIDLTGIETDEEGAVPVRASIGIGELVVAVPREATIIVDARVAVGEVAVRGLRQGGFDVRLRTEDEGAGDEPLAFRLQLEAGIGSIRVVDDDLGEPGGRR